MLNLFSVELRKLAKSKTFWISLVAYVVIILSTFIPVSFTKGVIVAPSALPPGVEVDYEQLIEAANEVYEQLQLHGNFVEGFFNISSGVFAVITVGVTLLIVWDFLGGTMGNILLSGHSRRRIYAAKLVCGVLFGIVVLAVTMIMVAILGATLYQTPITAASLNTMVTIFAAQCYTLLSYVAVSTAFAFAIGNGWAVLASCLFFTAITPIPLYVAMARGQGSSLIYSATPGFLSITGVESYIGLDAMLANPRLWTPSFVTTALLVNAVLVVLSTILGLRIFEKRDI